MLYHAVSCGITDEVLFLFLELGALLDLVLDELEHGFDFLLVERLLLLDLGHVAKAGDVNSAEFKTSDLKNAEHIGKPQDLE